MIAAYFRACEAATGVHDAVLTNRVHNRKQAGPLQRPLAMTTKKFRCLSACVALLLILPSLILAAEPSPTKDARIDNARIFPFFASGGGWESTIMLINVFEASIGYRLSFRGINGQPLQ